MFSKSAVSRAFNSLVTDGADPHMLLDLTYVANASCLDSKMDILYRNGNGNWREYYAHLSKKIRAMEAKASIAAII